MLENLYICELKEGDLVICPYEFASVSKGPYYEIIRLYGHHQILILNDYGKLEKYFTSHFVKDPIANRNKLIDEIVNSE